MGRKAIGLFAVVQPFLDQSIVLIETAGQLGLPESREVILEHIVERKRIDDLAGSIMDGRFHEQKVCH